MSRKSQIKGKQFEQELVNTLKAHGLQATRTAPLQAGLGSEGVADVYCPDIGHIEAKRRANGLGLVYGALEQSDSVVFRADRKGALIIFTLDSFLDQFFPQYPEKEST